MTPKYLVQILEKKQSEINALLNKEAEIIDSANSFNSQPSSFKTKLDSYRLSLIAEVKKASPSKGIIRQTFDPKLLAVEFKSYGASALSVLTEIHYFLGDPKYIQDIKSEIQIPILRKDFIINPIQVYESKMIGADAILLIKAILNDEDYGLLLRLGKSLNLDVLTEVHNEEELESVLRFPEADLIGVNNRNLATFEMDMRIGKTLIPKIKQHSSDIVCVAESGYSSVSELVELEELGVDAVLIGEGLAKSPDLLQFFTYSAG